MKSESGILLSSSFTNNLTVGGELAWFSKPINASTGYVWSVIPDNSGVYEQVGELTLHPSTDAVGVPGEVLWQFKAVRSGIGGIAFELHTPAKKLVERIIVNVDVK
jgi:predicted secreted protein